MVDICHKVNNLLQVLDTKLHLRNVGGDSGVWILGVTYAVYPRHPDFPDKVCCTVNGHFFMSRITQSHRITFDRQLIICPI